MVEPGHLGEARGLPVGDPVARPALHVAGQFFYERRVAGDQPPGRVSGMVRELSMAARNTIAHTIIGPATDWVQAWTGRLVA